VDAESTAPHDARGAILEALRANRTRRASAESDLSSARTELGSLIEAGARRSVSIPEMARAAGIGVETAYLIARNTWGRDARQQTQQMHAAEVEPLSVRRQ
jgi:hypothetical protein